MNAWAVSLCVLLVLFASIAAGAVLQAVLPEQHLNKDSREIIHLCIGLVGTLAALVLGLLISSAKESFDSKTLEMQQIAVGVILLDQALRQYGPEAAAARKPLLAATTAVLAHAQGRADASPTGTAPRAAFEAFQALKLSVLALAPGNDAQRWQQSHALTLVGSVSQATEMLHAHEGSSLPPPFLYMLASWLGIIFGSLALFSPRNATVRAVMMVCAVSASGAIFLILEMDRPFSGWISVSTEPLNNAIAVLGR